MTFKKRTHVKIKSEYMEAPGVVTGVVLDSKGDNTLVAFDKWCGGFGPRYNQAWIPTIQLTKARPLRKTVWV